MRNIEIEMAILSDFDLDGTPDWVPENMASFTEMTSDLDDDNDGMSDTMEAIAGTSSLDVDTDDDGFCDGVNSIQGHAPMGQTPAHWTLRYQSIPIATCWRIRTLMEKGLQ